MVTMPSAGLREFFLSVGQLPQSITVKLSQITMTAREWRELLLSVCSLQHPQRVELDMCTGPSDEEWKTIEDEIKSTSLTLVRTNINLPEEILRMDAADIEMYKKLLAEGEEKVYNIRLMIVGHFGVGKTVLTKRLMNQHQDVDILTRIPTEGIDVHVGKMKVNLKDENWMQQTSDDGNTFFERKAKVVSQQQITEADDISDNSMPTPPIEFHQTRGDAGGVADRKRELESKQSITNAAKRSEPIPQQQNELAHLPEKEEQEEGSHQESSESSGIEEVDTNQPTNGSMANLNDDSSRETEMKIRKEISEVRKVTQNEQSAYLSIWDFAGQYAFYDTHQVFMSWRTIYLLVTDLSKEINEAIEEDNCYVDCMGSKQWTVSEFAEFWLNAIHKCSALDEKHKGSFAGKPDFNETDKSSQSPPVILVGTFADKLQDKNVGDKRLEALGKGLKTTTCKDSNLVKEYFVIDNKNQTDDLNNLRKTIFEVARKQRYWGESKPARWIDMEIKLRDLNQGGTKILEKKVLLENMMKQNGPITTADELNLFLKFHHETGNLIYFSEDEGLNKTIVLDPQWLINAFKRLNPQREFFTDEYEIFKKWKDFDKYGIIPKPLIETMWKEDSQDKSNTDGRKDRIIAKFFEHKEHILDYLEKLQLLAKPHKDTRNISNVNEFYFAPSFVKQKVQDKDLLPVGNKITTSKLCFAAKSGYIPSAVFNKLLATCIAAYPLKCVGPKRYLLFCGCGIFKMNDEHELFLLFNENTIQIWLSREASTTERAVCIKVKQFFESKIPKEDFDTCFKCPQTNFIRMDGGFKLKRSEIENAKHELTIQVTLVPEQLTDMWFPETENNTRGNVDENICENIKQPHRNCKYHGGLIKLQPDEKKKIVENCGGDTVFGAIRKIQALKSEGFATDVAIRRIHVVDEDTKEFVRRKINASRVRHPFIVPTYAIFKEGNVFYFISPYCKNGTLESALHEPDPNHEKECCCRKMNEANRIRIAFQVASAILYLRESGLEHGDISSKNIVLDGKLNARLIDFKKSKEIKETDTKKKSCKSVNEGDIGQANAHSGSEETGRGDTKDYAQFKKVIVDLKQFSFKDTSNEVSAKGKETLDDVIKYLDSTTSTTTADFKGKNFNENVVDKLKELIKEYNTGVICRSKYHREMKCDVCWINPAADNDLIRPCCRLPMKTCIECIYSSSSSSLRCFNCDGLVKPIGHSWGAIVMAGKGINEQAEIQAKAFKTDAKTIKKLLKSNAVGMRKDSIVKISSNDERECLSDLRKAVDKFTCSCECARACFECRKLPTTMFIYFSGHGEPDKSDENNNRFIIGKNDLNLKDLTKELQRMKQIKKFVIILDRCYAPYIQIENIIQMNACSPDDKSEATMKESTFTKYFNQAFRTNCPGPDKCDICEKFALDGNNCLTVDHVLNYIKEHFEKEGIQQKPVRHATGSDTVIAYRERSTSECDIGGFIGQLEDINL